MMKNQTRINRLQKLADFLLELPADRFDYSAWVEEDDGECGTVCCAIGWMPKVDPKKWKWKKDDGYFSHIILPTLKGKDEDEYSPAHYSMEYFGIDGELHGFLFEASNDGDIIFELDMESDDYIDFHVPPTVVAKRILKVIDGLKAGKLKEYLD